MKRNAMITGVISGFGKSKPVVKNRWVILQFSM